MVIADHSFGKKMFGCKCFHWNRIPDSSPPELHPFSLPAPIPNWPSGGLFATGTINLGEIEVVQINRFESIWSCNLTNNTKESVTFYRPIGIPDGFHCLGHYCQRNDRPLHGSVLVAREPATFSIGTATLSHRATTLPALRDPLDYKLIWSQEDGSEEQYSDCGYIWLPQPPDGYKSMGFLVTRNPDKPTIDGVKCVRADLTDKCGAYRLVLNLDSKMSNFLVQVWYTRPCHRGMLGQGVSVGTFYCGHHPRVEGELSVACLKNQNLGLPAMPCLDQIHALINHYGPTVFFHPEEVYLPSSVSCFFKHGALLFRADTLVGETIEADGSNLPRGGSDDGEFWIDMPTDDQKDTIKYGNLESAKLYVHVKPALGGTFTDIAMWVFCPFNGPATIKVGMMNMALTRIGEHVGDWEHFTLRISNFTGELWSIYFSQHSGGVWVDAYDLEFIKGNKAIVYASKNGHASYPRPGTYIQGSPKLGIGIRNDCNRSDFHLDCSVNYEIVAAEYLEDQVDEPCWLQFMRKWGPSIVYGLRTELDKIIDRLPVTLRYPVGNVFDKFPVELYGQDGPTGPKEKNNWIGDERW